MNCPLELIEGYLDQELDFGLRSHVEEHMRGCRACAEIYSELREQSEALRSLAPHYAAPARLRRSLREALKKEAAAERRMSRPPNGWRWLAIAASVLFACSLAGDLTLMQSRKADRDEIVQTLIAGHVRSLIGTHLLDVVSADQHTVKPWFNGKIDFSPEVKDFAPQGFPLVGGRLEYADHRTVAALIYRRRQHIVNVFTWPSASSEAMASPVAYDGFNVVHWSDNAMTYWAVSDLDPGELQQFKELYCK